MRGRAVLIWAACALSGGEAIAGWSHSYNGIGQNCGFLGVSAPGPLDAYLVGVQDTGTGNQEGIVLVTHDGGGSWSKVKPSPSAIAFYVSVHASSALDAFVGTAMGRVWNTTDGGSGWAPSLDAGMSSISGLGGWGDLLVVAGTGNGSIHRSVDGGMVWTEVATPLGETTISGILFVDELHGWARAGSYDEDTGVYSGGGIARTLDGGMTWEPLLSGEPRSVTAMSFIGLYEGWILSVSGTGSSIEKTIDGGSTWTPLEVPAYSGGPVDYLWDIDMFDRCEGWLALSTGEEQPVSAFLYTTDGGTLWAEIDMAWAAIDLPFPFPVRGNPIAMDFASRDSGFCGGFYEFIGTYAADGPATECDVPDPGDGPYGGDSGCGCAIVR